MIRSALLSCLQFLLSHKAAAQRVCKTLFRKETTYGLSIPLIRTLLDRRQDQHGA